MLFWRSAERRVVAALRALDTRFTARERVFAQKLVEVLLKVTRRLFCARSVKIPVKGVHDESSNTVNSTSHTTPR